MTSSEAQPVLGRIGPGRFFVIGVVLFLMKFALDRFVARVGFGREWSIFNYLIPNETYALPMLPPHERWFYLTMLAVALPFVGIGIAVTLRRLTDAQVPRWLAVLFFVPVVNLLFFAALSVLPTARRRGEAGDAPLEPPIARPSADAIPLGYGTDAPPMRETSIFAPFIPCGNSGAALVAVLVPAPVAVVATVLAAHVMRNYGLGLFVGMPFCLGMIAAVIYGFRAKRTMGHSIGVGLVAVTFAGLMLILVALEGLGCLIMLMPLALPVAAMGAAVGHVIVQRPARSNGDERSVWSVLAMLPAIICAEGLSPPRACVLPVMTAIEVDAPADVVWRNVVEFGHIDAPLDWPFRAGVAYPISARIEGRGVGAIRYCEFSTGAFVEPIEVWDEPRLLKFAVTSNPPPMREWSPFRIHPPHLDNFLLSHGGEFRLIEVSASRTRIEGTTWYENRMWPQEYWRAWSDFLIHRIHRRVLVHIKQRSESARELVRRNDAIAEEPAR